MKILVFSVYIIFLLGVILNAIFIIFHIFKYSLTRKSILLTLLIFLPVFVVLLLINISLFFIIPYKNFDLETTFFPFQN